MLEGEVVKVGVAFANTAADAHFREFEALPKHGLYYFVGGLHSHQVEADAVSGQHAR